MSDEPLVLRRVHEAVAAVRREEVDAVREAVWSAHAIFVMGAGRSGLVGRFFAMRLFHMGLRCNMVGETLSWPIGQPDLLVAISGSGTTPSVLHTAMRTKETGARVAAIVGQRDEPSPLEQLADLKVRIPLGVTLAPTGINPLPMGTLFELSTLMLLEQLVADSVTSRGILESDMRARHANLE